jgi:hypothetical protein
VVVIEAVSDPTVDVPALEEAEEAGAAEPGPHLARLAAEPIVTDDLPEPEPAAEPADDGYPSVLRWGERPAAVPAAPRRTAGWAIGSVALLCAFAAQLLHANRDTLAIDPQVGPAIRDIYGRIGMPLYPAWPLSAYEIRSAEAMTGRTAPGALDVVADIAMVGSRPAAAPLVRVVLRDRWSNIVGSRVVKPADYSRDTQLRWKLLTPGSLVPVQISLADPGASAQGYELDLCLPDRRSGLRCQLGRDPYRH